MSLVGQLVRVDKSPVRLALGGRYYAEAPPPRRSRLRLGFVITPLFPTTKTASHPVSNASSKSAD
jgi:hypothetical protein